MAKKDRRQEIRESAQELVDAIASEQSAALARFAPGFRIMDWFRTKLDAAFSAYAPEGREKLGSEFEFKASLVGLRRDLMVMQEAFFRKAHEYIRNKHAATTSKLDKELQSRWVKHLEAVRLHGAQGTGFSLDEAGVLYRGAFQLWDELQSEQERLNATREKKRLEREEKQRAEAIRRRKEEQERLVAAKFEEEVERDRVRRERRQQEVRDLRARMGLTPLTYETDVIS
ncbi:hypothetical protein HY417_00250 [Candidatus Kaiserbacteria bacterium]|nr:hypothetical protein [Candidatus Kaiserbacteria bacterium]